MIKAVIYARYSSSSQCEQSVKGQALDLRKTKVCFYSRIDLYF